jgi:glucoamylase
LMRELILIMLLGLNSSTLLAQTTNESAPGAPGSDAHWLSAAKNGFGTSVTLNSKVWFTLTDGVLSEVFYPTLDTPNVQMLQLVIVRGADVQTEQEDTHHRLEPEPRALTFRQINTAVDRSYTITKTYVTDSKRDSVLIEVSFQWHRGADCGCEIYVYYDPSLNNSGMHDQAWTADGALVAGDGDKASALVPINAVFEDTSNGFFGSNDGLTQLRQHKRGPGYQKAATGNVVQTALVRVPFKGQNRRKNFNLVLSFGRNVDEAIGNARASARQGFAATRDRYESGWHDYVRSLPRVDAADQDQFNMAAMVLKALEDKTYRGAMIASPSIPWGGGPNANESTNSGYHAVWSRDLYQVATAFLALGDSATARRALDYLFQTQQKPDGSFPQNSWLDGRPIGGAVQMDEVAFPIILAWQLGRTDRTTWLRNIKPAADYIHRKGPSTQQERWEEEAGFSPATIAAQIAGLVCAGEIARMQHDEPSRRRYLEAADEWARKVESWTATSNGTLANSKYYLRISANDNPNDGEKLEINSGGGTYDEREIVDAGFLELVRLGIKPANAPLIRKSLEVIDKLIKAETPMGSAWYRYNHDAYGEGADGAAYDAQHGHGRLWVLLTGERGEYELARGDAAAARSARARLKSMRAFANDGMMIPEQVWDKTTSSKASARIGMGTGSATPLAWSMAQFIRLALNIKSGRNLETPSVVVARFQNAKKNNGRGE